MNTTSMTDEPTQGTRHVAPSARAYRLTPLAERNGFRVSFTPPGPLDATYQCVGRGDVDAALDEIFDLFDGLLGARAWSACTDILTMADLTKLEPATATALLTATRPARNVIGGRPAFAARLRAWLVERGEPEVDRLLQGLE